MGLESPGDDGRDPWTSESRIRSPAPIVYQAFDLLHLDGRRCSTSRSSRASACSGVSCAPPARPLRTHVAGRAGIPRRGPRRRAGGRRRQPADEDTPRERSPDWVKIKVWRRRTWRSSAGAAAGSDDDLGSLIVAVQGSDGLVHAGQVGSGLDGRTRPPCWPRSPNRPPDPPIPGTPPCRARAGSSRSSLARVEFAEWTPDGLLRQPTFLGVLVDRDGLDHPRRPAAASGATMRRVPRAPPPPGPAIAPAEPSCGPRRARGRGDMGDRRSGRATHEPRESAVSGDDHRPCPGHQARPRPLLRDGWRGAHSAPPTPRPDAPALSGRSRAQGVLAEGPSSHTPAWISRRELRDSEGIKQYVVVDRVATLAWLAQEAAIELHPWTATIEAPDRPRYALIDIDPGEATTWEEVLVLARLFRTALGHLGSSVFRRRPASAASRSGSRSPTAIRSTRPATGSRGCHERWARPCPISSAGRGRSATGVEERGSTTPRTRRFERSSRRTAPDLRQEPRCPPRSPGTSSRTRLSRRTDGRCGACPRAWPKSATCSHRP